MLFRLHVVKEQLRVALPACGLMDANPLGSIDSTRRIRWNLRMIFLHVTCKKLAELYDRRVNEAFRVVTRLKITDQVSEVRAKVVALASQINIADVAASAQKAKQIKNFDEQVEILEKGLKSLGTPPKGTNIISRLARWNQLDESSAIALDRERFNRSIARWENSYRLEREHAQVTLVEMSDPPTQLLPPLGLYKCRHFINYLRSNGKDCPNLWARTQRGAGLPKITTQNLYWQLAQDNDTMLGSNVNFCDIPTPYVVVLRHHRGNDYPRAIALPDPGSDCCDCDGTVVAHFEHVWSMRIEAGSVFNLADGNPLVNPRFDSGHFKENSNELCIII